MDSSHNRPLAFLALLLAFQACAAEAQQPSNISAALHISGKVIDARSGQALARCVVEIEPTENRGQSLSLETGDDGHFNFGGLRPGKYALSAARRGYLTQSYQEHEGFSTAIAVGPELNSEDLLFNLMPQAIFYGTVSDEAGEPVRNAQVHLYQDQDLGGIRATRQRQVVPADDRGMYEIANIAPGNYFLGVSARPWYATAVNGGQHTIRFDDPQDTRVDSPLDVAYPLTFYPNATDSDEAVPIPTRGGERIEANMTLTAQHAMRLQLPLTRTETGRAGISIEQTVFGQPEPTPTTVVTNKEGVVEISGVVPGRYDFTVFQAGSQPAPQSTHFTADVAEGTTQLSTDSGVAEVTVSGKVTSLDSKMRFAEISLVASNSQRNYSAPLNNDGEFTVQVIPGEYQVIGQLPQMYIASISSPNTLVKGRMLQVKAGDAPRLEIVAGSGYGQIEGLAERASHATSGVMVLLAPLDAKDNQILFRRDQSDSDGTFLLSNIIPGSYRLLAIDDGWELDWADPSVLSAYLKKSIPVRIHAHDKLKQTVEVQSR